MPARSDCLVLIPAFNEGEFIAHVVQAVRAQSLDVLVVDDGSADDTAGAAEKAGARVIRHALNRGKGAALHTGFQYAADQAYAACLTLDGDGQHDVGDIHHFLEAFEKTGTPVILGNRMADPRGMPVLRRWTNRVMSYMLSRVISRKVPDTQNGFRLYARETFSTLMATRPKGYAAESEVLLRLADAGFAMESVPVRTLYGRETSSINPVTDTWRYFRMLRKYCLGRGRAKNHGV